jgi:glucokinase
MLLGFDIGGTKCSVILGDRGTDNKLRIVEKQVLYTNQPVFEMIESLFKTAQEILERNAVNKDKLEGIGISCGGPLSSKKGIILSPPNLPGWDNIQIVEMAEKRFGIKAILQNDANACAVAEWKYGAGQGFNNLIFLTFGTGMGAGMILNGNLYPGASDLAGEVGHIRLADIGPVGFGKAGSFEGFCSGGGISQLAQIKVREKLQMGQDVSFCHQITDLPEITAKTVAEAAYRGDETALEIFKICGEYLGRGIAILIDIINPELIILGSIYVRAQSLLDPYMMKLIKQEALADAQKNCKIVSSGLKENIGDIAALSLAEKRSRDLINIRDDQ